MACDLTVLPAHPAFIRAVVVFLLHPMKELNQPTVVHKGYYDYWCLNIRLPSNKRLSDCFYMYERKLCQMCENRGLGEYWK